jgi:hypothetical protein
MVSCSAYAARSPQFCLAEQATIRASDREAHSARFIRRATLTWLAGESGEHADDGVAAEFLGLRIQFAGLG